MTDSFGSEHRDHVQFNMETKEKKKGQMDEVINAIKKNEFYQKIDQHELTGKLK